MRTVDEVKLKQVYDFIKHCHTTYGKSPTYRKIGEACGINSTAWVSSLVNILEERELIELVQKGNHRVISVPSNLSVGQYITASIVGSCPCGEPVLAEENIISTVALPTEIFGTEEHFILRATGNSMIKRGIFDGDLMVVRIQNTANLGDVVIARVNNDDATAKVLACENGKYYLEPANDTVDENGNPLYKNIYPEGNWCIVGVVDHIIHAPLKNVI